MWDTFRLGPPVNLVIRGAGTSGRQNTHMCSPRSRLAGVVMLSLEQALSELAQSTAVCNDDLVELIDKIDVDE